MLVKATMMGYIDHKRKYEGDVFDVSEKGFSENWMMKVDNKSTQEPIQESEVKEPLPILDNDVI